AGPGAPSGSARAARPQGTYARRSVAAYPCFRTGWYRQYPGAWFASGWAASSAWNAATWNTCSSYCGIVAEPIYYDYGENVGYQTDGVYYDGQLYASEEKYYDQAVSLADTGRRARGGKQEGFL